MDNQNNDAQDNAEKVEKVEIDLAEFAKHMHNAMNDFIHGKDAPEGHDVKIDLVNLVRGIYAFVSHELDVMLRHCGPLEAIRVIMAAEHFAKLARDAAVESDMERRVANMMGDGDESDDPMGDHHGRNE